MLHHFGFNDTWIRWVKNILDSGTSLVLLNGVPGNIFRATPFLHSSLF
uniref:Uncharacterized protein n=1 Tax=Arundo donax TaxID=35708 RepID=A0A0A9AVJ8_ARUDO